MENIRKRPLLRGEGGGKMIRLFVVCALALFFAGCSSELDDLSLPDSPLMTESGAQTRAVVAPPPVQLRDWAISGAKYDEAMDVWMALSPDYVGFSHAMGDQNQSGEATHYGLKIYPKTEQEQWEVESMEGVGVSYIPFGYKQLTVEEVAIVEASRPKVQSSEIEVSPYVVTYEGYESTDGGPVEPQTFRLPVLYVVWPVSEPLPAHLEYTIDHELVIPVAAQTLRAEPTLKVSGYLEVWDNLLNRNVPLGGMTIEYEYVSGKTHYGDDIYTRAQAGSNSAGGFTIETGIPLSQTNSIDWYSVELTLRYSDSGGKWRIVSTSSTAPTMISLNVTFGVGRNHASHGVPRVVIPQVNGQLNEIQRAANYFFNVQTDFPRNSIPGGIKIEASPSSGSRTSGSFGGYTTGNPHISISPGSSDPYVVGTTLHELGHFAHWTATSARFSSIHTFVKESFASYVGWWLGEKYYTSMGWRKTSNSDDITGHGRQGWYRDLNFAYGFTQDGWYSPLFVDLTDDYNEKVVPSSFCPTDEIIGVSPSVVWDIVKNSTTWEQHKQAIFQRVVPVHCSQAHFNQWIDNFDHWINTYHHILDYK